MSVEYGGLPRRKGGGLQAPDDSSPLVSIREKEQELAQQIRAARGAAEAAVAQAHQRAAAIKQAAEHDGLREAEAYYRQQIDKTKQVAASMQAAGREEAHRLREAGRAALGRAVQVIIQFVLPT